MGSGYAQLKLSKFIPDELVTRASMHSGTGQLAAVQYRSRWYCQFALPWARATPSLRLCKIVPDDFVRPDVKSPQPQNYCIFTLTLFIHGTYPSGKALEDV